MLLAWVVGFGLAAAWLARLRDRLPQVWAIYGAILGPVALILLWIAPPGRCAICRAPVRGWLTTCQWCGSDVRGRTTEPVTVPAVPAVPANGDVVAASAAPAGRKSARAAKKADTAAAAAAAAAVEVAEEKPVITVAPTRRPRAKPAAEVEPPAPVAPATGAPPTTPPAPKPMVVLASGVFMTGTIGLSPGSRYDIETDGTDLRVVGSGEKGRKAVAFERKLVGIDATGVENRLIISAAGGRGATVLVFMSIDGGPSAVADAIARAVQAAGASPA